MHSLHYIYIRRDKLTSIDCAKGVRPSILAPYESTYILQITNCMYN